MTVATKSQQVLAVAHEQMGKQTDWVRFYRSILGSAGIVRHLYQTREELAEFEKTPEHAEIQAMLAQLRIQDLQQDGKAAQQESCRVITVRLPASMHESLKDEAHIYKTSVNQLCISKLAQILDLDLVPTDRKPRNGEAE